MLVILLILTEKDPKPQDRRRYLKYYSYIATHQIISLSLSLSLSLSQGAENCLAGLTFVLTGVGESLNREEAADLVKKYGGRVTTSLSKKTSYLVMGDDAGEIKIKKVTIKCTIICPLSVCLSINSLI